MRRLLGEWLPWTALRPAFSAVFFPTMFDSRQPADRIDTMVDSPLWAVKKWHQVEDLPVRCYCSDHLTFRAV
jgi:hypothetical protein